jgi:hypothetical protein
MHFVWRLARGSVSLVYCVDRCALSLSQTLAQPLEGQAGTASNDQTPLTSFLTSQIVCEYAAEYVHPLENA